MPVDSKMDFIEQESPYFIIAPDNDIQDEVKNANKFENYAMKKQQNSNS